MTARSGGDIGLLPTRGRAPTPVVSDAGSIAISLGSSGTVSWDPNPTKVVGYNPPDLFGYAYSLDGLGLIESTLLAAAGGEGALGGTLSLTGPAILFRSEGVKTASGDSLAATLQPTTLTVPTTKLAVGVSAGLLTFGVDRLQGSGIDSLYVSGRARPDQRNGVIGFSGDLPLSLGRRIVFSDVSVLTSVPLGSFNLSGTAAPTTGIAGRAIIAAPYVAIRGKQTIASYTNPFISGGFIYTAGFTAPWLPGSLSISADAIDVGGSVLVQNTGTLSLESRGDLRFIPVNAVNDVSGNRQLELTALLRSAGDIIVRAAQVYPATAVSAVIQSTVSGGAIAVVDNGNAAPVPLSAGGALYLSAAAIIQSGVVRAPLGSLVFGVRDDSVLAELEHYAPVNAGGTVPGAAFQPTQRVELAAGSISSVSAAGMTIPYGQTSNLRDWTYAASSGAALGTPPEKSITINAPDQTLAAGAIVDMRGGGDVYAYEWIAGLGGSRNVLTTSTNGDASAPIYAIVPAYAGALAPVDAQGYGNIADAGDTSFNDIGRTLTIGEGVAGLPAGTYLLLPGAYATLPGAFRVQLVANSQDSTLDRVVTLADGTQVVAGRLGYADGAGAARTQSFAIQSQSVWRQYSEINQASGNAFFTQLAANAGKNAPRLPIDAGRLSLVLQPLKDAQGALLPLSLSLGATLQFAPGEGGRGGQSEIAAPLIDVVSAGAQATPAAGGIVLTPADIRALSAESVLLGGTRSSTGDGDAVFVTAQEIRVFTTADDPLANPEIILAAQDRISIAAGSVITASASVSGSSAPDIRISGGERFNAATGGFESVGGDGALLRVSAGNLVGIVRSDLRDQGNPAATDSLSVGAGAVVNGGGALQLDASGRTLIDMDAVLGGRQIDIGAREVNFLDASQPDNSIGQQVLSLLNNAQVLSVRAGYAINFARPMRIAAASGAARLQRLTLDTPRLVGGNLGGDAVSVDAGTVVLGNTYASDGSALAAAGGSGVFRATADALILSGNDRVLSGFERFEATSTRQTIFGRNKESGTLKVEGSVSLVSPLVTLGGASQQTLQATGAVAITGGGAADAARAGVPGGFLAVDAASVTLDTTLSAPAGIVELRARSGDVAFGSGATLYAGGLTQQFVDTRVVYAGGQVTLQADNGNVILQPGARLDLASDPGGTGGELNVVIGSAGGSFAFAPGTFAPLGNAAGRGGGNFSLDTRGQADLDNLAAGLTAGAFIGAVKVASRLGDLVLTRNLAVSALSLVADGGRVRINAVVDASGTSGGRIALFGVDGVTLQSGAQLLARATTEAGRGGQVTLGTSGSGLLDLAAGSRIDVAGGSDYGSGGGIVHLRVPFLDAAEQTIGAHVFGADIVNATAVILEPYQRIDLGTAEFNDGVIDAAARWDAIFARFTNPATSFGAATQGLQQALGSRFFVMPGLELVNDNPAANSGDITITAALDLLGKRYDAVRKFPGILTLRAAGDLRIDASISDGFSAANAADNTTAKANLLTCANAASCTGLTSCSYNFVAGARTGSADPLAVEQAAVFATGGALENHGNFVFGSVPQMGQTDKSAPLGNNDIIRTGTGWINVIAGGHGLGSRAATVVNLSANAITAGFRRDDDAAILFTSPTAVLYTAGMNVVSETGFNTTIANLASRSYDTLQTGLNTVPSRVGLVANTPAFAFRGGDIRLEAPNGSILGQQNYTDVYSTAFKSGALTGQKLEQHDPLVVYAGQLFTPWLLGQGSGSLNRSETGVFGGLGVQSARWVLTGAFQQGVAAFGGGDVSVQAGGKVDNISVSVVSTYRVIDGTSVDKPARLVTYGGGNLAIEAGGRIGSIVTLVDKGQARIRSGDTIAATYQQRYFDLSSSMYPYPTLTAPVGPLFFIGDASLDLQARGSIEIGAVAQPEFDSAYALDRPQNATASPLYARKAISLAYGEDSELSLASAAGDVVFKGVNLSFLTGYGGQDVDPIYGAGESYVPRETAPYDSYLPPTVRIAAPQGDVTIQDGLFLAPAAFGNLEVLANGSIYLFAHVTQQTALDIGAGVSGIKLFDFDPASMAGPTNPLIPLGDGSPYGLLAVVDDPATPINWRLFRGGTGYALDGEDAATTNSPVFNIYYVHADPVLHKDDVEPVRIIALNGDIINGNNPQDSGDPLSQTYSYAAQGLYFDKQATIYAGRDILNLIYVGFNASVGDVTSITAGRDITYDVGYVAQDLAGTIYTEARGSTYFIGGPGQFILQAGRDLLLKPSEPASSVKQTLTTTPHGVQAVGNRLNPYLPAASADLGILFGVGPGLDQQAFVDLYINPVNAGSVTRSYAAALTDYMEERLTREARERDPLADVAITLTAEEAFALFGQLSPSAQLPFVQQILFAEIRAIADQLNNPDQFQNYPRAYQAIATLFPARLGYTDNLASAPSRVATGDFDMLDAVVRTEFGSGITILGPGGRATLGGLNSLSTLPANVQGVFTLRGGDISAYVDGNFDVFNSRVLTLQGGDITIMSGNGNVDAGRGRNTERVFPPLVTLYNAQTTAAAIDFSGLVSGAGIGTIAAVPGVPAGDVFLLAPHGVIDAGAAGIRATGNLFTVAPTVLNAENIQAGGESFGISPTSGPSVSTLSAASGAADKAAAANELVTAAGASQTRQRRLPTLYSMELIGFGGWDGPE